MWKTFVALNCELVSKALFPSIELVVNNNCRRCDAVSQCPKGENFEGGEEDEGEFCESSGESEGDSEEGSGEGLEVDLLDLRSGV